MADAAPGDCGGAKRLGDEPVEAPEAKRIRAADLILLDTLDDADPADGDLASVMRSFEEEIASLPPPPADDDKRLDDGGVSSSSGDPRGSDLGYLLEASDDELGLPPTAATSSSVEDGGKGDSGDEGTQAAAGFGQIWGLEDEIPGCYDALDFGVFSEDGGAAGQESGVVFDAGLFDSPAELPWQPESLHAI